MEEIEQNSPESVLNNDEEGTGNVLETPQQNSDAHSVGKPENKMESEGDGSGSQSTENTKKVMIKKKTSKKQVRIESDSESDNEPETTADNTDNTKEIIKEVDVPSARAHLLADSDSEAETEKKTHAKQKKSFKLIDTDSEPELDENQEEKEEVEREETNEAPIYTVNDKKELVPERSMADSLVALCDPESSDDEAEQRIEPMAYRKKPKKKGEEPEERRMTAKEAAEQRKEIESYSQRTLRETHVALPYHKPKQRGLKEFLRSRPKFASSVPADVSNVPAAVAIKMNPEQLDFVSKKIEEREKQVEEFYKSESEEEEEEEGDGEEKVDEKGEDEKEEPEAVGDNDLDSQNAVKTDEQEDISQGKGEKLMEIDNSGAETSETTECEAMDVETPPEEAENTELPSGNPETTEENDKNASGELRFNLSDIPDEEDVTRTTDDEQKQDQNKKSTLELLKGQLANTQPKLSGAPNCVIDLEDGTTHVDEVTQLMRRFARHNAKPLRKKASAVRMGVVRVSEGGDVRTEQVALKVAAEERPEIEERPGVKHQKLRDELQSQMAARRNELWRERQARAKEAAERAAEDEEYYRGERDACGIDDILDDEEEEFSDAGSDEAEDEEAEDDESEDEEDADGEEGEEDDEEPEEQQEERQRTKKLRRILQPLDSDSEEEATAEKPPNADKTDRNMDSTVSWPDDDYICAGQTSACRTPNKQSCMQTKSELGFLSPVCRLTGLQSFDATGRFLHDSPGSPLIKLGEPSPLKNPGAFSKSLFTSPAKEAENLEELCSGAFPRTQCVKAVDDMRKDVVLSQPDTQDMLELCSGGFGFTQGEKTPKIADKKEEIIRIEVDNPAGNAPEVQIDEDEDRLISQLVDEDELETFKKKFESPLQPAYDAQVADERIAKQIAFTALAAAEAEEDADEDEDEDDLQVSTSKTHRKRKIIDSDEEDVEDDREEGIDLCEDVDQDDRDAELGYDSEENEIRVEKAEKPKRAKRLNMRDFYENEAELSESEWGSEDEDERDLDVMDAEEGDKEQFDEEKIRNDLERIHMRRLLDEDKKNLKVLQELLLDEDEELKGAGRQRQFRWRNIDNVEAEDAAPNDALEEEHDADGENEEEWRKKRHERELFLKSQKQNVDADDDADASQMPAKSQLFKLGQRVVLKNKLAAKTTAAQINTKQAYVLNTQRGSFLSRKDEVLARVAEYTKVADVVVGAPKNSRNFVFQSVRSDEAQGSTSLQQVDRKRKAGEIGTPAQLKRLRLTGMSPADQKKKPDSRSKARLFSNSQW